jgi:hypothetical protein
MLDASFTALERPGSLQILVTDLPGEFGAAASRFLGKPLQGLDIRAIDL